MTSAADPVLLKLWNTMNGSRDRWIERGLVGGWIVVVLPGCRVKRLRSELPAILVALESQGINKALGVGSRRPSAEELMLTRLGVSSAWQHPTSFPGSIYCTVHRDGGMIPDASDALAEWVSIWLSGPAQRHNIDKLLVADVEQRHIFVLLPSFSVAPFGVMNILMETGAPLPTVSPELPQGVSHIWIMSTWSSGDIFTFNYNTLWASHPKC